MENRYVAIFALEGAGIGVILYLVAREIVRSIFDITAVIPQFPHVGIVANVVGGTVVLVLVVIATISVIQHLGLHKV